MKMSDIARLAGVSSSTVSRALNNSPLISEATRAKIMAIAETQNYFIDRQASNFRLGRTGAISIIIPFQHAPNQHVSDPFFMDMLGAIADYATEHDYDLLISRANKQTWRQKPFQLNVDGAIFMGQSDIHLGLNDLVDTTDFPFVVWGAMLPDQKYTCVSTDNRRGARDAVNHLLNIGRRRILFLGDTSVPEVKLRYEGYEAALHSKDIALDQRLVLKCPFEPNQAYNTLRLAQDSNLEFDAIFACSDIMAMNAIKALSEVGLNVPEDISVTGYDDISISAYYNPPITTVRQNIPRCGKLLCETLIQKIQGDSPQSILLPAELVVRGT